MSVRENERRSAQSRADHLRNGSFTIAEWCVYRKVSRAMLYKLFAQGKGPATHKVGSKRLISSESDADWLRACEAESAQASIDAEPVTA